MATHSSVLAWRIPWTEEPGGLQSTGSQKSRTRLRMHTHLGPLKSFPFRESSALARKVPLTFCAEELKTLSRNPVTKDSYGWISE